MSRIKLLDMESTAQKMKLHWPNDWRRPGITEENSRELNGVATESLRNKAYRIEGKPRASVSVREKKNQVSARVIGSRENEGRGGNMKAILRNNGPQFSNFCENDHLQIPEAHWSKDRKCNERSMHTVSKLVKTNRERVL